MQDLYKQAILDAKAVRASAIANAKATLQEAFAPQVEALVKKSLSEDAEAGYEMEEGLEQGHEYGEETTYQKKAPNQVDEEMVDETTLEEILAELEELEEDIDGGDDEEVALMPDGEEEGDEDDYLNEAEEEEEGEEEAEEEEEEGEEEEEEGEDEATEGPEADEAEGDDEEIVLTFGQLKAALAPFIGGGESTDAADVDLDEILGEDYMEMEEGTDIARFRTISPIPGNVDTNGEESSEIYARGMQEKKHKKEMDDAKSAIDELRSSLNEVNLLNAKLLYMNKIFKAKSLTESQKVKVVNAFDRANNVKEVKNIFATLNESMSAPKKQLKESYNAFASKPSGYNPKQNITETDPFISRMQVLAGIK